MSSRLSLNGSYCSRFVPLRRRLDTLPQGPAFGLEDIHKKFADVFPVAEMYFLLIFTSVDKVEKVKLHNYLTLKMHFPRQPQYLVTLTPFLNITSS